MKNVLLLLIFTLSVLFAETNTTQIPGATGVKFYFGNYPYLKLNSDMPILTFRIATDLDKIFYKNAPGNLRKLLNDGSGATNTPAGRVFFADSNGAASSKIGFTFDGTLLHVKTDSTKLADSAKVAANSYKLQGRDTNYVFAHDTIGHGAINDSIKGKEPKINATGDASTFYNGQKQFVGINPGDIGAPAKKTPWNNDKCVVTNASGNVITSVTTATEIGYVSGLNGPLPTALNARPTGTGQTGRLARWSGSSGLDSSAIQESTTLIYFPLPLYLWNLMGSGIRPVGSDQTGKLINMNFGSTPGTIAAGDDPRLLMRELHYHTIRPSLQ